ncbi:hypothetical protein JCM8097_003584 [Rhodosporidiobolus ruineniae]
MHRQQRYQLQHTSHQQRPALPVHASTSHHRSFPSTERTSFNLDGESDPGLSSGSSGTASDSDDADEDVRGGMLGLNRVGGALGGTGQSEPDPLAAQATHALRTLKRSSLMTHPTSDYFAFSSAQSTALDRAKQLLGFVSEDVPSAMLPQIDALEKRAEKTVRVLEGEKENLVGAEAVARQKKANDLIAHLSSLHTSVLSNRDSLKPDLEALGTLFILTPLPPFFFSSFPD